MAVEVPELSVEKKAIPFAPSRWTSSVGPLAVAVLVFSLAYFYSLPRLNMNSYDASSGGQLSVGFNEKVSLRTAGRMQKNQAVAFKMSLWDERKHTTYKPTVPPYLRASVSFSYMDGPRMGIWQAESGLIRDPRTMRDPLTTSQISDAMQNENDIVTVNIIEKGNLGEVVPAIPPYSQNNNKNGFSLVRRDWRLLDTRESAQLNLQKRRYSYTTYSFKNGEQNALLPDYKDCLKEEENIPTQRSIAAQMREALDFPDSLRGVLPLRDRILAAGVPKDSDKLTKALYLEEYFGSGRDYKYTLNLSGQTDRSLDPIADFLVNKKTGHCQFFASTLAMLLRSLEIPTRVVVGFRPSEYNEFGNYFLVQQSHAHVWVEAYFTVQELKAKGIEVPSYIERGAWMRLDPTPPGEGSNSGGSFRRANGQTMEMMQELWSEMVLNMDKSKQSTLFSFFGESSDRSYAEAWLSVKGAVEQIRSIPLWSLLTSPSRWFSWQVASIVILVGSGLLILYRFLLWLFPNVMPRIRLRPSFGKTPLSKIDFYNRAIKQLQRFGLQRGPSETQREFFQNCSKKLGGHSVPFDSELFSRLFYLRRFGGQAELDLSDQGLVDAALQNLETDAANWQRRGGPRPVE